MKRVRFRWQDCQVETSALFMIINLECSLFSKRVPYIDVYYRSFGT